MYKVIGVLLVVLVMSLGIYSLFGSAEKEGKFTISSVPTFNKEDWQEGTTIYFGYKIDWEGDTRPTLTNVEVKRNGMKIGSNDQQFSITPYVFDEKSSSNLIGVLSEQFVDRDTLMPVNGHMVDDHFYLVLSVELLDSSVNTDVDTLEITYKINNSTNTVELPLEKGFITNE
ncbi:hypothetical protein [Sutcliffiella sp. NC1]|uniref:hypothetical protein n=1 Tax=Sutcliffiella sp. NC1 TaxID=3004096 RepID=UPI0022DD29B3|nr:hypothetical protein [Sutcliffiella sp. NC1]WBL17034.1 hypothetical protein O1A01_10545 [Sutcliffiella sp. NC1]